MNAPTERLTTRICRRCGRQFVAAHEESECSVNCEALYRRDLRWLANPSVIKTQTYEDRGVNWGGNS